MIGAVMQPELLLPFPPFSMPKKLEHSAVSAFYSPQLDCSSIGA